MPNGLNEATPLVHDGVIFVHSFGDNVQALDATTGDLLWQYSRKLPSGVDPSPNETSRFTETSSWFRPRMSIWSLLTQRRVAVLWDHEMGDYKKMIGMIGRSAGGER